MRKYGNHFPFNKNVAPGKNPKVIQRSATFIPESEVLGSNAALKNTLVPLCKSRDSSQQ